MSLISIIHPTRGRVKKSLNTFSNWINKATNKDSFQWIVSVDHDDPELIDYLNGYAATVNVRIRFHQNRSSVDAINNAVQYATGNIIMVVSDDTDCFNGWDTALIKEVEGKTDWIMKTQDGIQNYILTMPLMDRAYYNRYGYIYHPGFSHLFCDTYMTCVADINGRKLTSNLMFKHNHYSVSGGKEQPDALHKRNDATWKQGEELFIKLMKEFTPEERGRIKDPSMKNWLRNHGII